MISVNMIALLPPLAYLSRRFTVYLATGEMMFWMTNAILIDPPSISLQIF